MRDERKDQPQSKDPCDLNRTQPLQGIAAHCGLASPDPILEMERWRKRWTVAK